MGLVYRSMRHVTWGDNYGITGGSHLSPDFWEHEKLSRLKHYLAYQIIIKSLIIQRNLAEKIWAKWESSLTAVWLKWDLPVTVIIDTIDGSVAYEFATYS